jgi:hypothetical protein
MYWSKDQVAGEFIAEGKRRGIAPRGMVICIATGLVESQLKVYANPKVPESMKLPHDAVGSDGMSVGALQQQVRKGPGGNWWWGSAATCMDPSTSSGLFYDRLVKYGNYPTANDHEAGLIAQDIQQSAFPLRYEQRMPEAQKIYDRLTGDTMPAVTNQGDPVWLEDVLRPALGDRLKTLPGWKGSGHGDFKDIRGVMVHHTGNSRESAESIRNGRPDLPGPLSNLHIAPDGTVTIVAVGVCWHAGEGSYPWLPTDMANFHTIGIECAWPDIRPNGSYNAAQRWPDPQIISIRDTCAALCLKLGVGAERVIRHQDWAGASQGKWDAGNMSTAWLQGEVAKDMRGEFDPKPNVPPTPQPGPILPPDYSKEVYDQLRIEWKQLGEQTLVNAIAEIRDKVCAVNDYANWKAGK